MNIKSILSLFTIFFVSLTFAQDKQVKVYLDEHQFYTPEIGSYLEIQLNFAGYSLNYITEDSLTFAEVEITQIFSQKDSVILADRYLLKSPFVIDSIVEDFYDIQKYPLSPGTYKYELFIKDVHSDKDEISVSKSVEITDFSKDLMVSSFIPAESIFPNPKTVSIFTRIGYDVVPMNGNYYPTEIQNLLYYFEIYNSDKFMNDSVFVVHEKILGRDNKFNLEKYNRFFRYGIKPLQPVSKVVDISQLPTGSYTLEIDVLDRDKTILARKIFEFDRNNTDEVNEVSYANVVLDPEFENSVTQDSSAYFVASLIPIARQAEVKNIIRLLKEKDVDKNIKYLQAFWLQVNPKNPFDEWIRYKAQVQLVERLYATNFQVGFETDRGRVYLQYGAPNSIYEEPSSPSEYPYEIWQYDKINQYSNRRFIFYNPTNLNKDYQLLHSDMLGEIQNKRWQYTLNKRNTPDVNFDDPTGGTPSHFGGNSSRYFKSY